MELNCGREYWYNSFQINTDLSELCHMLKVMSLRLSPKAKQRLSWMDAYRECNNATQVCRHFSIPLRTFWRWKKRYDPWDLLSLEDKPRKPKHSPRKISTDIEYAILNLKKEHPRWGKEKIAFYLSKQNIEVSPSTCYRICKRHSRIIRYRTRKRKAPKPRVNWDEIRSAGDLIQVDTKHLSFHGQKVYQYSLVDVISRWKYAQIHYHADMATTIKFLKEALTNSPVKVKMMQTDNGSEFGRSVSKWCSERKLRHVFTHKRRPQENAYVERSHRTDEEEFYSIGNLGSSIEELRINFAEYLNMYNTKRPHWGLGGRTPIEVINLST